MREPLIRTMIRNMSNSQIDEVEYALEGEKVCYIKTHNM